MKKYLIVIFGISLFASLAFGDEIDPKLSTIANEQIRIHTRAMITTGVPGNEAVKLTLMMMQNNYRRKNIIRAQQTLIAAAKESLPVKPVMNKAFEGIAKNAPEELVIQAMEKTRYRYSGAYNLARQITQNTDRIHGIAKAIAEGFTAGMHNSDTVQVMNRLLSRTPQSTKANIEELAQESFLSLRDMVRLGVSSTIAKDVVCHAYVQEYSIQKMKQLHHSFMIHAMSTDPAKLAARYSYAISQGVSVENLSSSGDSGESNDSPGDGPGDGPGAGPGSGGDSSDGASGSGSDGG